MPIPFQIDKRREVNFIHNIDTPTGAPELLTIADNCALSYFPPAFCNDWSEQTGVKECPANYGAAWQSPLLGPTDEIVFMARDLVSPEMDTAPYSWLDPNSAILANERMEILITDDGNQNGSIEEDEKFWVYAYVWADAPPTGMQSTNPTPSTFTPDSECAPCSGVNSGNNVHNRDCGSFVTVPPSGYEGFETNTLSNWQSDVFGVIDGTGTALGNILQAFGMSASQETGRAWDCINVPRPLGIIEAGIGQVRSIRGIQGAASGAATMKYDKIYDTYYEVETELRVHDISDIRFFQGHNANVKNTGEGGIYVESHTDQYMVPQLYDQIDGGGEDNSGAGAYDWTQFLDTNLGGVVSLITEDPARGPIDADEVNYYYDDPASTSFGNFGREWIGVSCMQDGDYPGAVNPNFGGCGTTEDPESEHLLFRRFFRQMITSPADGYADPAGVVGDNWSYAVRHPLIAGVSAIQPKGGGAGGGQPPCIVHLNTILNANGEVKTAPGIGSGPDCTSSVGGFGITAQVGTETEEILGYVPPGESYVHRMTELGQPHSYRAFAVTFDGAISAKSTPVVLVPQDNEPPDSPSITAVSALDSGGSIDFVSCKGEGVYLNAYISTTSGGPYVQANTAVIYAQSSRSFTFSSLSNGVTYFAAISLVDANGNESTFSNEVSFTPQAQP